MFPLKNLFAKGVDVRVYPKVVVFLLVSLLVPKMRGNRARDSCAFLQSTQHGDDVYVHHGGRSWQTEQIASFYGNLDKDQRYKVMGWTRGFQSVSDAKTVLMRARTFRCRPQGPSPQRCVTRRPIRQLQETGSHCRTSSKLHSLEPEALMYRFCV